MKKFSVKEVQSDREITFMKKMVGLMSLNWVFLFAVTYGKYGWDVGEPLSFLTNMGVELAAMMGYFEMYDRVQKIKKGELTTVMCRNNI